MRLIYDCQQQNGVPYIVSMQAGPAYGAARDQGYTFVAKSVFQNKEDMEHYETKCEAHQEYKDFLKANVTLEGLMALYFTPSLSYDF
jgi:Stress responsive A/B Barrel Domain